MYETNNPSPSLDERDFYDNILNLDKVMNSDSDTWNDRFGVEKPTIAGALRSAGFTPAGFDFVSGGTLQIGDRNKAVYNPAPAGDGNWYKWGGVLPKDVAAGSQPNPKDKDNWSPIAIKVGIVEREVLRRTYQESGYTLVEGSFEQGAIIGSSTDVVLYEANGKCYSGPIGTIPAKTNPLVGSYVDRSLEHAGYIAGATAPLNTIFSKLQESVSFLDYIPKSEHSNILKGISSYDCTNAIQEAFNECFRTGRALVQQGGVFKTTGRVSPTEAQAGTGNFDMPYSMFFGNVVIDYHGVGGTAFEIKNTASQKSIADGLLLGSLEVINSGSGQYGIVLDGLNFWQVGKIKGGAAGKTFSERGVLIKSNSGKGGLWSSYQHVIGYGGKTAVEIGQTANANQFGRVWAGYSSEKCFINAGARNTFNLLSIEFLASNGITHAAFISAPYLINGYEAESDGTPANFVSSLFIDTTQPVLVNQASFVGHSPRYSWVTGAKLVLWPARTATELANKLEIITSEPLEIADSVTPKKAIRNLVTVDSNNGGAPGTFGSYLSLLTTSFSGTLDLSGVLVNNNTTANLDMQIRFTDFEGVDSTSRTINIPAGQTLRLNQSDFIECLDPDKRYYLLKARFRPSAGITGAATVTSAGFRM